MWNNSAVVAIGLAGIVSLITISAAHAADTALNCEAGKLKEAGRYANCRMKADAKAAKTEQAPDYAKCVARFGDKWGSLEAKGAGECPSNGDHAAVETAIATCMGEVAASLAPCAGVEMGGACWFLSPIGDDCDTTCAAFGLVYDEATRTYAGSDGTNANCQALMDALGADGSGAPFENNACDSGYGCVVEFGDRHRCTDPATDSVATASSLFRVCACAQ